MLENSGVSKDMVASQEELASVLIELVNNIC
jgi:hypothetical protein